MKYKKFSFYTKVLPCIIQFVILLVSPVIFIIVVIFSIWKRFIIKYSKYVNMNFEQPVDSSDLIFVSDDFSGEPHSMIPLVFVLDGYPDAQRISSDLEKIYERRCTDGSRIYWKLACYPVQWCGYWFWKKTENFIIANQIEILKDWKTDVQEDDLPDLAKKLIRKSIQKNSPLWDLTVVPNYKCNPNKSILVFRFSHAIFDGLSMIKFYFKNSGIESLPKYIPVFENKTKITIARHISMSTKLIITGLARYLTLMSALPDKNSIHNLEKYKSSGNWICSMTKKLSIQEIKRARIAYNCSFFDILLTIVVGGLRNYMIKHYPDEQLPHSIHTVIPVPKPNHPDDTMVNHWNLLIMRLPLQILKGQQDTVTPVKEAMKTAMDSPLLTFNKLMLQFLTILPLASYTNIITDFSGLTLISSAVQGAGPVLAPPFFGAAVSEIMYWMPINRGNLSAISWGCFTSNGNIRITLNADTAFIERKELLNDLADLIQKELSIILEKINLPIDLKKEN